MEENLFITDGVTTVQMPSAYSNEHIISMMLELKICGEDLTHLGLIVSDARIRSTIPAPTSPPVALSQFL